MLLRGHCEVLGLEDKHVRSFVVRDRETNLAGVVGEPKANAIREAVDQGSPAHLLFCQFESGPCVTRALPEWQGTSVLLHRLGRDAHQRAVKPGTVRLLSRQEVSSLETVQADLRTELIIAAQRSPVSAVEVDGAPVCLCYAVSLTEKLWDISIETREPPGEHEYAERCVSFMIAHMRGLGLEPVWGVLDTNEGSLALAESMGFVAVDRSLVFQRG
jgi:hypothetical protein